MRIDMQLQKFLSLLHPWPVNYILTFLFWGLLFWLYFHYAYTCQVDVSFSNLTYWFLPWESNLIVTQFYRPKLLVRDSFAIVK